MAGISQKEKKLSRATEEKGGEWEETGGNGDTGESMGEREPKAQHLGTLGERDSKTTTLTF